MKGRHTTDLPVGSREWVLRKCSSHSLSIFESPPPLGEGMTSWAQKSWTHFTKSSLEEAVKVHTEEWELSGIPAAGTQPTPRKSFGQQRRLNLLCEVPQKANAINVGPKEKVDRTRDRKCGIHQFQSRRVTPLFAPKILSRDTSGYFCKDVRFGDELNFWFKAMLKGYGHHSSSCSMLLRTDTKERYLASFSRELKGLHQ